MIQGKQLWASHAKFMNDTLEGTVLERALEEFLKKDETLTFYQRDVIEHMYEEYRASLGNSATNVPEGNHFLLCGSRDGDALTLWRNYARESISYAVGLDPEAPLGLIPPTPLFGDSNPVMSWGDVTYSTPGGPLPETIATSLRRASSLPEQGDQFTDISNQLRYMVSMTKSDAFVDERETRLVVHLNEPRLWRFRAGRYGLTPYIALGAADEWGQRSTGEAELPIRQIRISANAQWEDKIALNALLESNGYGASWEYNTYEEGGMVLEHPEVFPPPVQILQAKNSLRA